jgi:hypothetical protein
MHTVPAVAAARTQRAVGIHHHVADLAGEAIGAADQRPTDHHPATDAGSEGDHHHVGGALRRAHLPLRGRGTRRVVVDPHMTAQARRQQLTDAEVGDVDQVG